MMGNPATDGDVRRFAREHLLSLAKMAIDTAMQPIVEAATGAVFGYEALMRGQDRMGFGTPLDLLDHAAREGHLQALEQMLASRALAKFATIADTGQATLFLNLDGRLISAGCDILDALLLHLQSARLAPSCICFELSERFDIGVMPEFSSLVARLRTAGFKLAIDDFGVGCGEIRLLCDHAVDYLKIDRHFITGLDSQARKRHLVRTMVQTAHGLGVRVIAEGIETEGEFIACRDLGVDLVQGWYIDRPAVHLGELKPAYPHLKDVGPLRRSSQSRDEILIRKQIERLPTLYENDSIDTVFALFRRNPRQTFFPVLNANGEPRGIIHEIHLKDYIYHPFGRDLLKNRLYHRNVSHFVDHAPVVGLDADADRLMSMFALSDGSDCVLLTENMRYAGVISAAALVRIITEKQLKSAEDQNPLTGLPGNRAIGDVMQEIGRDDDQVRHLCYCDFDNFKPFNDHYGFHLGDHAISLFAALMRRYFFAEGAFLGHVGGDDFFIGLKGWSREAAGDVLARLQADFSAEVAMLYTPDDRARGSLRGEDRHGTVRDFPLMRCSIGVLELPAGLVIDDGSRFSAEIAAMKSRAKDDPTGLCIEAWSQAGPVNRSDRR